MSVVLIFPPYADAMGVRHSPPLGINHLATFLKINGVEAYSLDLNAIIYNSIKLIKQNGKVDLDIEKIFALPDTIEQIFKNQIDEFILFLFNEILEEINIESFDMVGLSVAFGQQLPSSIWLAKIIKNNFPKTKIILGGSQITLLTESQIKTLKKSKLFDEIIIGEGEKKLLELSGVSNNRLKNVEITEFDNMEYYENPMYLPVLAGKGCHWGKCAFCDYQRLLKGGGGFVLRPVKDVLLEIKNHNQEYNPFGYRLIVDAVPPKWYEKLAKLAIDEKTRLKTESYILHEKSLDQEFFKTLEKAGAFDIIFGTETTNDRVLELIGKKANFNTIKSNLEAAKGCRMVITINIIPDLPFMTFDEIMQQADIIENMADLIDCINGQYFDLTSGCEIAEKPEKFGFIKESLKLKLNAHGYHGLEAKRQNFFSNKELKTIKKRYNELQQAINGRGIPKSKINYCLDL